MGRGVTDELGVAGGLPDTVGVAVLVEEEVGVPDEDCVIVAVLLELAPWDRVADGEAVLEVVRVGDSAGVCVGEGTCTHGQNLWPSGVAAHEDCPVP